MKQSQKRSEMVVKTNAMVGASYRLSVFEQKIVLFVIARAREEDKGLFADQPLLIQAKDFAAFWGIGRDASYQLIKETLKTLFKREITLFEPGKVTHSRWVSQIAYMEGAGAVSLIFAPAIIEHISRIDGVLSSYTRYQLENIGKLTSAHAVRIYEMLSQFSDLGTRTLKLNELRTALTLDKEYPRILDFKKSVLDISVTQINEHTDLEVGYEQVKNGRTVEAFNFSIKRKKSAAEQSKKNTRPIAKSGSDSRAKIGESQDAFERRMMEEKHGQKRLDS